MSRPPSVSVVIPTYNHRDLILETLDSVFAQSFRDYQVIVVNDGSPDDTEEVLRPLIRSGKITYVPQPNQGQGAARNRGLAEARGRYIAFLDDDDLWPPDKLQWQVEALNAQPRAVLVYGEAVVLHRSGELNAHPAVQRPSGWVYEDFRQRNWITSPGQTLIRTSALRHIGGFDPGIWGSDDWDLYVRLARWGEFHFSPKRSLLYRWHEGNASRNAVRHVRNHFKVVQRHLGWNLPRVLLHQRQAAFYFVPNLERFGQAALASGDLRGAVEAYLYAATFQPSVLIRPRGLLRLMQRIARRALRQFQRSWRDR